MLVKRIEEFYTDLFSSKVILNPVYFNNDIQNQEPPITSWEIKQALKESKTKKAPGSDNILIEMLKEGGDETCGVLAKLFSLCLHEYSIPI